MIENVIEDTIDPPLVSVSPILRRKASLWPVLGCTLAYTLCILLSVAVIARIGSLSDTTPLGISSFLAAFGAWIPQNLGLDANLRISLQKTAYLEWMILLALTFIAYGLCAFIIYRDTKYGPNLRIQRLIWFGVLAGGLIYLFTPGILTTDLYSYASYGRLLTVHASNPYFVPPSAFPSDPIYSWVYWKDTVSIYGPVWTAVSAFLDMVSGIGQINVVLAYRIFAFAADICNVLLVAATLKMLRRSYRTVTVGTLLYAWNPLVLNESSLGAHNDVFMITFVLLGFYLCARAEFQNTFVKARGYIPPLLAFTLATLVKFSAASVVGVFILALVLATLRSDLTSHRLAWRAAIKAGVITSLLCLTVVLTLYGPFWAGHSITDITNSFTSLPSATQSYNSILAAAYYLQTAHSLPAFLSFLLDRRLWNVLTVLAMGLPILIGAFFLWRAPTTRNMAVISLASLAGFLCVTPWFFDWYLTWIVGIAVICLPVIGDRWGRSLVAFALTFSATSFLMYYSNIVGYLQLRLRPPVVIWATWTILATLGIPLLVFLVSFFYPQIFRFVFSSRRVTAVQQAEMVLESSQK